jgi:hypothetical protein
MAAEPTLDVRPRILVGLSSQPGTKSPLVAIAGHPFWSDTAPSLSGPVDEEALRSAFLRNGESVLRHLDGAFAVIVQTAERTFAVTDRFNVIPLYVGEAAGRHAISTDSDALARYLGVEDDLDLVTMAQALRMWYATHPYTFYRDIRELQPASVHQWHNNRAYSRNAYWEAHYRGNGSRNRDELAEELAAAIDEGVRRRIEQCERPGLLLSAGADSRGILFSASRRQTLKTYTFFDSPNAEFIGARKLAEAAEQEHSPLRRPPEYYGHAAVASTCRMGGMWCFLDGHSTGFSGPLREDGLDLLLTGDFADLIFKGNGFDVAHKKLFGRALPLKTTSHFRHAWRRPGHMIGGRWMGEVASRLEEQYDGCAIDNPTDEDWWKIAHARVGVLSRTPSYGGIAVLQRTLPWDTFMADASMTAVYEQMGVADRVNAGVWERAVRILTPKKARRIANNNILAPVGASDSEKVARFLYGVAYRKIMKREVDGTPLDGSVTRGSWPNFETYMSRSPVIAKLWSGISRDARAIVHEIRGENPWAVPVPELVGGHANGFARLLTQALWLDNRKSR